jgi:hypothetical protein
MAWLSASPSRKHERPMNPENKVFVGSLPRIAALERDCFLHFLDIFFLKQPGGFAAASRKG